MATTQTTGDGADGGDVETESTRPHSFFWLVLLGTVPAVAAAVAADTNAPSYALGSEWLYHLEVGLAVFAACYLCGLAIVLSYQGRSIGRLDLPGGGGVAPGDPAHLQVAADDLHDFQEETRLRLKEDTASLASLEERVQALQADAARLRAAQEVEARFSELRSRLDALEQPK